MFQVQAGNGQLEDLERECKGCAFLIDTHLLCICFVRRLVGVGFPACPSYGFLRMEGAFPRSIVMQRPDFNLQLGLLHDYLFQALCNTLFAALPTLLHVEVSLTGCRCEG